MRLRDFRPDERPAATDDPATDDTYEGARAAFGDTLPDDPYGPSSPRNANGRNGSGVRRTGASGVRAARGAARNTASADSASSGVRSAMRRSSQAAKSYATRTFPAVSADGQTLTDQTDPTLATPTTPTAPARTPRRARTHGPDASGSAYSPGASRPSGAFNPVSGASFVRSRPSSGPLAETNGTREGIVADGWDTPPTSSGRRRKTARPASAQEQALVERTTLFLDATEVLNRMDDAAGEGGLGVADQPMSSGARRKPYAPMSPPFADDDAYGADYPANDDAPDDPYAANDPLATRQLAMVTAKTAAVGTSGVHWADAADAAIDLANDGTERLPATFIPGAMTSSPRNSSALITSGKFSSLATTLARATTLPPTAPRRRRRWVDALMTVVVAALLLALLSATSPLWRTPLAQAQQRFAPQGASASIGQINQPPTGPWSSSVSVAPNLEIGGGAGPGVKAPGSAGLPGGSGNSGGNGTGSNGSGNISPAPIYPWPPNWAFTPPPGYYSWSVTEPANDYYWWAFGQCTWWAQHTRGDENLRHMGNAQYWASSAAARGYSVGTVPVAGATVVFQPGVQGAGGAGHVAHVEKVYPDGWFLISEMNFYWNGGGWGRVDYRYAHSGWGVQFIY